MKLDLLDSESDVNLGVRQYVKLVSQDKVNFLLGSFSSDDVLDDSSVSEKYQIPMVQGGGASNQIFSRGYKYIFGTLPSADDYFKSTIAMVEKLKPKATTAALVAADDAFDVSVARGTRPLLKQAGIELIGDYPYSEHSPDFSSILSVIKSTSPDLVLWTGHEPEALNFIRQAKSLNVSPKLMYSFTDAVPSADFRTALGKDANYAFGMTPWLPLAALKDDWFGDAASFADAYQKKFGYAPDYHTASGVAVVETLVKAIEAAGGIDPVKVRDAIAKSDFQSLYGHIAFGANGQISLLQSVIQVQDGKVTPIFSTDFINKALYPLPPWNERS